MPNLYAHQLEGVKFLVARSGAMLTLEMGLGKTRCALVAAQQLFAEHKIDRVLVLAPAAVRISWREEIFKLSYFGATQFFISCVYEPNKQKIFKEYDITVGRQEKSITDNDLPIVIVSYALLPQQRHVKALAKWAASGKTLLLCDESSFLKNRTAKQTKGSAEIAASCEYKWLLTGTPIANSPLDLYGQALVMQNGTPRGPLDSFKNFYHFRARYAQMQPMHIGRKTFQQVVGYQHLDALTAKFAPYVLRRTKAECLDLPAKTYTTREVQLDDATWRIYQELRRDALLALPDEDVRPEPNAAVRILRLRQLTSGHVGGIIPEDLEHEGTGVRIVSSEKLDWIVSEILDGELSSQQALIIWCHWRSERERIQQMLATKIEVYGVFGGQQPKNRSFNVQSFQTSTKRRVLVAQQHSGGFGLNLTAASVAVYLSNSGSYIDRVQSIDRIHRIGQKLPCLYVDALAVGPKGQRTVDHHTLYDILGNKRDLAEQTCRAW